MNLTSNPTREQWLENAITHMTPLFETKGYKVPKIRVSCGWPSSGGTASKKRCIGQCWDNSASSDGLNQIFISPWLDEIGADYGVLATLVHEVVHAVVGIKAKHGKIFKKCALAVGLEGKMTSTFAGEPLMAEMKGWAERLGKYDHAKLDLTKSPVKKQSTRMVKCTCLTCGYIARTSMKWIEEVGAPVCPKDGPMTYEAPAPKEEDEE